jgi:NADP-dependent 3-hydroxy acid dehydrogenase YdfG
MPALNHQTAVVTGASSGIGAAMMLCKGDEEARLHLTGRHADALEAVAQRARTNSPRVRTYQVDLNIEEDLAKLKTDHKLECDGMDIMGHSAGVVTLRPLEAASLADFDRQHGTKVRAPYALKQTLLPMLPAQDGSLIFINLSTGGGTCGPTSPSVLVPNTL